MKKILKIVITILMTLYSFHSYAVNSPLDISVIYGGIHNNKVIVFFNIKSPKGIKTYWKTPGFGGIPPEFLFDNNPNLGNIKILYTMPKITTKGGITNYTLKSNDYIAISFLPEDPSVPITLRGTLRYGYCDTLCKSDNFQFNETFTVNETGNETLKNDFFASMPTKITPDETLIIKDVSALYNAQKNLLLSLKIDGLKNLDEKKFIYYIDTDFEINKPIIRKTDNDKYQISFDLFNIYKKPKYLTLIFPDNNDKNVISKHKIYYKGK
jgi:DsbC/DsbD-like thiol-disulfide interchange protein